MADFLLQFHIDQAAVPFFEFVDSFIYHFGQLAAEIVFLKPIFRCVGIIPENIQCLIMHSSDHIKQKIIEEQ